MFGDYKSPPLLQNPNSTFKPSNYKHPQKNFIPNWNYAKFRCLVIQNPRPYFKIPSPPSNSQILNTHNQIFIHIEFILILDVGWFESWYIPQALGIPIFAWRNTPTKRNDQNTALVVLLTYIWMVLECMQKCSAMGLV